MKASLSPISSQESTTSKSESLNNQETTAPGLLTMSRPTGINRRSAVLHSKKARQLGTAKAISENGEGNLMRSEGSILKSKPEPTANEKEFKRTKDQSSSPSDEKIIKNETDSLKVVETSLKSTDESENPVVEARENFCFGDAHVSKNKTELRPCVFPESGSDASDKVKTETKDKLAGRKRLRSASETFPALEKKSSQTNLNESQNEDTSENHRQYATRGMLAKRKIHFLLSVFVLIFLLSLVSIKQ